MLPMALWFVACGINWTVNGKVVDAKTGQPLEGVVVAVNWQRAKLGIPGLPVPYENYGTFESLTDVKGIFKIPKFLIGHHYMAVYKTGYLCWSSKTIFNPDGKNWHEMFMHRYGHRMKSGMVVKLKPKSVNLPAVKHANFVQNVDTELGSPIPMFTEATKEEYKIYENFIKNQVRQNKR